MGEFGYFGVIGWWYFFVCWFFGVVVCVYEFDVVVWVVLGV